MSEVLDLAPRLRWKQQKDCKHLNVEVANDSAELSCRTCGRPLDPWWFLRRQAADAEEWGRWFAEQRGIAAQLEKDIAARVEAANQLIARLNDEIRALNDTRSRLQNESANGRLHAHVRRPRRRA
jgi:DNA repair exonuclease SbcCD ATPase subunit